MAPHLAFQAERAATASRLAAAHLDKLAYALEGADDFCTRHRIEKLIARVREAAKYPNPRVLGPNGMGPEIDMLYRRAQPVWAPVERLSDDRIAA